MLYIPVILTTADLYTCNFNPDDISINDGTLKESGFKQVPLVRFRKSLTTKPQVEKSLANITAEAKVKERTVFIINAKYLIEILKRLSRI